MAPAARTTAALALAVLMALSASGEHAPAQQREEAPAGVCLLQRDLPAPSRRPKPQTDSTPSANDREDFIRPHLGSDIGEREVQERDMTASNQVPRETHKVEVDRPSLAQIQRVESLSTAQNGALSLLEEKRGSDDEDVDKRVHEQSLERNGQQHNIDRIKELQRQLDLLQDKLDGLKLGTEDEHQDADENDDDQIQGSRERLEDELEKTVAEDVRGRRSPSSAQKQ